MEGTWPVSNKKFEERLKEYYTRSEVDDAIEISSPVGSFTWWLGDFNRIPKGWVICNGSTIKNTDGKFNSLANALGFGSYQNIVLPDQMGRFIKAGVISGQLQGAGLPNITGTFSGVGQTYGDHPPTLTGSFYLVNDENNPPEGIKLGESSSAQRDDVFGVDASLSNPTYGRSDTVTPENISAFPLIYTGTSEQFYGTTASANLFVYPTDTADTVDQYLYRSRNNHVIDRVAGAKYILPNIPAKDYETDPMTRRVGLLIDGAEYANGEDYNVWVAGELYYAWFNPNYIDQYHVMFYTKSLYVDANTQTYINCGGIMVENGTYSSATMYSSEPTTDFYFLGTADMLSTEDDYMYVDVGNLHSSQVSLFLYARQCDSADDLRYVLPKHIRDALTPVTFKYRYSATSTETKSKYMDACSIFLPTEKMLKQIPCATLPDTEILTCEYGYEEREGRVVVVFDTIRGEHGSYADTATDPKGLRYYVIAIS